MNIEFFPTPAIIAQIGPVSLHAYGAMYALSAVLGYMMLRVLARRRGLKISGETLLDFVFWAFLGGLIGGRMFYVAVYDLSHFLEHPEDIIAVWKGGMSIHGGLLGGVVAGLWFIHRKKLPMWEIGRIVTPAIALGMMLGRIGNFLNGELCGRITEVAWAIECGGNMTHPSQLYAVGKDFLLLVTFLILNTKTQMHGKKMFGLFLMLYAVLRFGVEFFRAPDPQIGFFWETVSLGQILSVVMMSVGIFLFRTAPGENKK